MSENHSRPETSGVGGTTRHRGVSEKLLLAALVLTWMRMSDASADEQVSIRGDRLKPDFNAGPQRSSQTPYGSAQAPYGSAQPALTASMLALPPDYRVADPIAPDVSRGFRPKPSTASADSQTGAPEDLPSLRSTTVWQRLADYRSHGRVRLLTLWEGGASTVSLQAGRKGEPSLQWTSRRMNHGGATRGLFDPLFSVPLGHVSRGVHPVAAEPPGKAAKLSEPPGGSIK